MGTHLMHTTLDNLLNRVRHARGLSCLRAILSGGVVAATWLMGIPEAVGQPQTDVAATAHQAGAGPQDPRDCGRCHYCSDPSRADLCLYHPCGRSIALAGQVTVAPDVIILDKIEGECRPVSFEHRRHATMAEMSEGCATCHHHAPSTGRPPPCGDCHDRSAAGTNIDKPGLKGAYHQQCLNCHRDWIDETACEICHVSEAGAADAGSSTACGAGNGVLAREHPRIPQPDGLWYGAGSTTAAIRVVFGHERHIDRFGLKCVECHHEPNCAQCHSQNGERRTRTLVEHHRPCLKCHKLDMTLAARDGGRCRRCHWSDGRPEPRTFDHADTGWPLEPYHGQIGCRACHIRVPFEALDRRCDGCHRDWDVSSFDHRVTGQILDEAHASLACDNCHSERRFDQPPACGECHEPEEGITFPERRPGPVSERPESARPASDRDD